LDLEVILNRIQNWNHGMFVCVETDGSKYFVVMCTHCALILQTKFNE
jgi:hypothetical protein